jgi:hypothetical protein
MKFLKTNLPMPSSVITGAIGMKQVGKSLFAYEQGYPIVKEEGGEVVYYDTEEPDDFMFTVEIEKDNELGMEAHKAWKEVFAAKYGIQPTINYTYVPNVEEMMALIGVYGKVIITEAKEGTPRELVQRKKESAEDFTKRQEEAKKKADEKEKEKGVKYEFKPYKVDTENSAFNKLINEKDIRYVVFDSITVFNTLAQGGRQNLGLRSQTEESFFSTIKELCAKRKAKTGKPIYVFTTNHVSFDPTDRFSFMDEISLHEKGGKTIGHTHKVLFGLKKKTTPHGAREMVLIRYPNLPEYGYRLPLLITDEGFQNTTLDILKDVKEEQKAEARGE